MKLELNNLDFEYKTPIFKKLNFTLTSDSFISIIGDNNSGKTTLLKILNGDIKTNNLLLNENKANKNILDDIVSYVDKDNLFFSRTVYDELSLYTRDAYNIKKALQVFKMKSCINKSPNSLSNEEKIILKLIIVFFKNPKFVLLDNIFSCFSQGKKNFVLSKIKKYAKKNKIGVILTTNNLYDSIYFDELLVINNYRLTNNIEKTNISLPFTFELCEKLKLYELIDEEEYDIEKLVDKLC